MHCAYTTPMLTTPPTSLYIHIPWCVKKCPYCDFNSHEQRGASQENAYVEALLADLDADLHDFPWMRERRIETVFFGGGTPSLFAPDSIARILDGARARLRFAEACETTLETNPGTVEHGRFDGYARAGVNRISFGVQSFNNQKLKRLGRIHDADEARRAVAEAQDAGIAEINIDLMYALPDQDIGEAVFDIEQALLLRPTHVSHYQLTLEPNTVFAAHPPKLPDDDSAWDMQEQCQALLASAGYPQYEVSAYAGGAHECRHNLNYWRFGDYLGIGAGAHAKISDVDGHRILRPWKLKNPRAYLDSAGKASRLGANVLIEHGQLPFEFMLNALRLNEGFRVGEFESTTGLAQNAIQAQLQHARQRGWLDEISAGHWRPTELGARFLNDLIELFLP
jgi:putative oxygen-independent coproporphyrinogen III oxidase